MGTVIQELIGKKVVVHAESGGKSAEHRGVLEAIDNGWLKLKKDNETIFFCLYHVAAVRPV